MRFPSNDRPYDYPHHGIAVLVNGVAKRDDRKSQCCDKPNQDMLALS